MKVSTFCLIFGQFSTFINAVDDGSDYYGKFEIEKNASSKEIRKAFKKLASKWHPDQTDHPDAHEKFIEITKIYEVNSLKFFLSNIILLICYDAG
jgi:DnaJ family protein C protein 10